MEVRPTANIDDIKAVLSHPVIWDAITVDGQGNVDDFNWPLYNNWLSIGGYIDGNPMAIMMFHEYLDGDQLHIHVLPEFREQYAREFAEKALSYAQYPLYAEIPDAFPNVRAFAESFGFVQVAKLNSTYEKHGKKFQITRFARCH